MWRNNSLSSNVCQDSQRCLKGSEDRLFDEFRRLDVVLKGAGEWRKLLIMLKSFIIYVCVIVLVTCTIELDLRYSVSIANTRLLHGSRVRVWQYGRKERYSYTYILLPWMKSMSRHICLVVQLLKSNDRIDICWTMNIDAAMWFDSHEQWWKIQRCCHIGTSF